MEFVFPTDGVVVGQAMYGVIEGAPHPEAAKLMLDWFLGKPGQAAIAERTISCRLPRTDMAPPPGGIPTGQMKVLLIEDWDAYLKSRPQFVARMGQDDGSALTRIGRQRMNTRCGERAGPTAGWAGSWWCLEFWRPSACW